ncbi:MAG TPA: N-acetylmuramoyl-L-alanine amidase [Burkholderiaceae bacterium]|nr:N-acetylmuramoyl-L-alanine amidase [Burkholderiaceae bacterium]
MRRQWRWHVPLAVATLMFLAACAGPGPKELLIDRSINAKSQDSRVEMVVLHYTATTNEASLKILSEQNVSSHYLITDAPRPVVYQLVDENRRAWHAGASQWYGRTDINAASIGIEIVNPGGNGTSWSPYTDAQIDTVITLLHDIVGRHQIKPHNIVGHSDIAPQRKVDPGPLFPWKRLADAGLGRWYSEALKQKYEQEFLQNGLPDIAWVQSELIRAGYAVETHGILDKATRNVVAAFQMHYRPARYDGIPDAETMAILKALH